MLWEVPRNWETLESDFGAHTALGKPVPGIALISVDFSHNFIMIVNWAMSHGV